MFSCEQEGNRTITNSNMFRNIQIYFMYQCVLLLNSIIFTKNTRKTRYVPCYPQIYHGLLVNLYLFPIEISENIHITCFDVMETCTTSKPLSCEPSLCCLTNGGASREREVIHLLPCPSPAEM